MPLGKLRVVCIRNISKTQVKRNPHGKIQLFLSTFKNSRKSRGRSCTRPFNYSGNLLFSIRIPISIFLIFSLVFPVRTRTDYGVEVTILAQCQIFLRRHHLDAFAFDNAHYNGRSELNQVRLYRYKGGYITHPRMPRFKLYYQLTKLT